jgi:hypothetical protein
MSFIYKKIMKKSILLIALTFISVFVFGQVEQPNRIEFEDKEYENYEAFSFGEKGALVLSKNEVSRKVYDYQFQLLSTNLKVIKTVNKQVSKNHTKITTYKDSLNLYILAQDVKKGTFEFFTVNISPFRIKK